MIRELLAALARQWDQLRAELTPEQLDALVDLVTALTTEPIPRRLTRRAQAIVRHLSRVLPDDHPLLLIREQESFRLSRGTPDHRELAAWQPVVAALRGRLPGVAPTPTVDEVAAGAWAWLLAADSIDLPTLLSRKHDPGDPELIQLTRPDGEPQWPAFQFRQEPLVRSINRILDAAEDPWGAADWWLGENGWLHGVPAELMGSVDDQVLVRAARDELAEVDDD